MRSGDQSTVVTTWVACFLFGSSLERISGAFLEAGGQLGVDVDGDEITKGDGAKKLWRYRETSEENAGVDEPVGGVIRRSGHHALPCRECGDGETGGGESASFLRRETDGLQRLAG